MMEDQMDPPGTWPKLGTGMVTPRSSGLPAQSRIIGIGSGRTQKGGDASPHPRPIDRIKEHIKSLVGAGISVYTAFFAFGAVRLVPELALAPALWAVPLITGLTLIIYHRRAVTRRFHSRQRVAV